MADSTPKTQDGADFQLGMTLYTEDGREFKTDADEGWAIDSFELDGCMRHCIGHGAGGTDLLRFYSSPNAVVYEKIWHATGKIRYWTEELTQLLKLVDQLPFQPAEAATNG